MRTSKWMACRSYEFYACYGNMRLLILQDERVPSGVTVSLTAEVEIIDDTFGKLSIDYKVEELS